MLLKHRLAAWHSPGLHLQSSVTHLRIFLKEPSATAEDAPSASHALPSFVRPRLTAHRHFGFALPGISGHVYDNGGLQLSEINQEPSIPSLCTTTLSRVIAPLPSPSALLRCRCGINSHRTSA